MPDEFSFITESDKDKLSYGACVGGMAIGRWVGLQGLLVGGIAGLWFDELQDLAGAYQAETFFEDLLLDRS